MKTLHHPGLDETIEVPDKTAAVLEKSGWQAAPTDDAGPGQDSETDITITRATGTRTALPEKKEEEK